MQPLPLWWSFEPSIVAAVLLAAGLYIWYVRRWPEMDTRPVFYWLGLAAFVVALITPLDSASDHYLLSAHMMQHILITMVGPPLMLAGLPSQLGGGRPWKVPPFLVNLWVGVFLFNVTLLAWHWPAYYETTLRNEGVHILEHIAFIATAFVFWWPITGPAARRDSPMSRLVKVGYLALAGIPPTVIGMILAVDPTVLYPFYSSVPRLFASLSAETDQQVAGLMMFGLGNLIYFVPITLNLLKILNEEPDRVPAGS